MSNPKASTRDNGIILWQDPEDWETRLDALLINDEGSSIGIQQKDNYVEVHKETIPDLIKTLKEMIAAKNK